MMLSYCPSAMGKVGVYEGVCLRQKLMELMNSGIGQAFL